MGVAWRGGGGALRGNGGGGGRTQTLRAPSFEWVYHLRYISKATKILDWLRFT
jgi:hypothetical protein